MMDHLRQIPQVGPAWADLPDSYTTLAWLAASTERVRLAGTVADHYDRARRLIDAGATTLIVRLVEVAEPGAVETMGTLIERLR